MQKVQSSALLLEKQRNPGIGYWSAGGAAGTPNGSVSRVSIAESLEGARRTSSEGPPASDAGTANGQEEEVNLEVRQRLCPWHPSLRLADRHPLVASHSTCATSSSSSSSTRRCVPTSSASSRSSFISRRRRRGGLSPRPAHERLRCYDAPSAVRTARHRSRGAKRGQWSRQTVSGGGRRASGQGVNAGEERAAGDWSRSLEKRVADIGGGEGTCILARRTRQRSVSAGREHCP
jgi:hypothetical protein